MTDPMERMYSEVATKVVALLQAGLIDVEVCQKSIRFLGRVEAAQMPCPKMSHVMPDGWLIFEWGYPERFIIRPVVNMAYVEHAFNQFKRKHWS